MEMISNIIWLIVGIILVIFLSIIKQVLRNKVQRNRIKLFVDKEKGFDGLYLAIKDKAGVIHFFECDDFENFGIGHDIIESPNKNLKEGESIEHTVKQEVPVNKVHFYVARDQNEELYLYIGKPFRDDTIFNGNTDEQVICVARLNYECMGLNPDDFKDLKWEDEPLEVFINLED